MARSEVDGWLADSDLLRHGSSGAQVRIMQDLLSAFGFPAGPSDGRFGPRTENALERYQYARLIGADGICGPQTRADMLDAYTRDWSLGAPFLHRGFRVMGGIHTSKGRIPSRSGKMSTFGGAKDKGDRCYGQALVPADNAYDLYQRHEALVAMGLFVVGATDPLPRVTDWRGRECTAGISYLLNPKSYYVAMRWARSGRPVPRRDRVVVLAGDRACVCAPTDWGPAKSTGRNIDISPGCEEALGLTTDDRVEICWGVSGTDLGPV